MCYSRVRPTKRYLELQDHRERKEALMNKPLDPLRYLRKNVRNELQWAICRCHGCKTRDIKGQVWEKHPDGNWRKGRGIRLPHHRTTTRRGNK